MVDKKAQPTSINHFDFICHFNIQTDNCTYICDITVYIICVHYGVSLLGSRGNIDVFLTLSRPRYNIVTLSIPIPPPA